MAILRSQNKILIFVDFSLIVRTFNCIDIFIIHDQSCVELGHALSLFGHLPSLHETLTQCCINAGPTLKQHWVNVCSFLGSFPSCV